MRIIQGHAMDLLVESPALDLVVTDPPYAFGGSGKEHELSATVAVVLRETARKLRIGSWLLVFSASSWRSISYMVESVRGLVTPVRVATWTKPQSKTKVRTAGWGWASVSVVAMRKGPKNRAEIGRGVADLLDHISADPVTKGRRAQLPGQVAEWAVAPFVVPGGLFLDPFAGHGTLVCAAEKFGMDSVGFEIDREVAE